MASLVDLWPLAALAVRTRWLEVRTPSDDDLASLAELAAAGVHDPDAMPFTVPWTQGPPDEVARRVLQYHWGRRAGWTPASWVWETVVAVGGEVVGSQGVAGEAFATRRTVGTGSWLGRRFQGCGIGTEMRQAVLHFAFAGLGAERAETEAWDDNHASLAVTAKLGYTPNGDRVLVRAGARARELRFTLHRERWEPSRRTDITIHGLEPCLPAFGAAPAPRVEARPHSG